jgi:hypothetical protein
MTQGSGAGLSRLGSPTLGMIGGKAAKLNETFEPERKPIELSPAEVPRTRQIPDEALRRSPT